MLFGAAGGALQAWFDGRSVLEVLQQAFYFSLIVYGAWALSRELDPDDRTAAFLSLVAGLFAAFVADSPGVLVVFVTLGLVRLVNRSTGLAARTSDSIITLLFVILVIYGSESPFFGIVAGLAFILDGSLREPNAKQWIYGLISIGATIVYMVDHDAGLEHLAVPDSLFSWLSLIFLLIFALNAWLLKSVQALGDADGRNLDSGRVKGGMAVGFLAALQGISRPDDVVIIIAVIAGICFGMAIRKGFKAPVPGQ